MKTNTKKVKPAANDGPNTATWITLKEYSPDLGAPFEVVLCNSARQLVSESGEVLETEIPNLGGLLKEIAVARALCDRKFSPREIQFARKALNLKGTELASLLGIGPEHLSRCENDGRALSPAADKLLRVIIIKRRFNLASLMHWLKSNLEKDSVEGSEKKRIEKYIGEFEKAFSEVEKMIFASDVPSVYDASKPLSFSFILEKRGCLAKEECVDSEDDRWSRAA